MRYFNYSWIHFLLKFNLTIILKDNLFVSEFAKNTGCLRMWVKAGIKNKCEKVYLYDIDFLSSLYLLKKE